MLDFMLKIQDQATKVVEQRTQAAAAAHASALLSAGYQLMRLAKAGVKSRAPGDIVWPDLHTWSGSKTLGGKSKSRRRRTTETASARIFTRNAAVWPALSRAIKYQAENAGAQNITLRARQAGADFVRVKIGFVSGARTMKFAAAIAAGQTITVTPKMRRYFFAKGIPLKVGKLIFPPREHMGAVYRRYHDRVLGFVQARVNAAAAGQDPRSIKSMF